MSRNSSAATPNRTAVLLPAIGPLAAPWPCPFVLGAAAAGLAAGAAGAAASFGGGAGQVMAPSLITVRPRIASSSMLTSMLPSLVLHSSSVRRKRLFAYSVDDCLARRLVRSV